MIILYCFIIATILLVAVNNVCGIESPFPNKCEFDIGFGPPYRVLQYHTSFIGDWRRPYPVPSDQCYTSYVSGRGLTDFKTNFYKSRDIQINDEIPTFNRDFKYIRTVKKKHYKDV